MVKPELTEEFLHIIGAHEAALDQVQDYIYKLDRHIVAKSALKGKQRVERAVDVKLSKPFDCVLTFYILSDLDKVIIGKPALKVWKYQTTDKGDHLTIDGRTFTIEAMEVEETRIHALRTELEQDLLSKFPKVFSTEPRPPQERAFKHQIIITDETPVLSPAFYATPEEKKVIYGFVDEKLKAGILVPAVEGSWVSPVFAIKQHGKYRVVTDLRPATYSSPSIKAKF
ncbi:uncharacterized protein J8A68_002296 [[Candida] subhashii]|uniref:Uncharacterized protein n=1 Tax=[Candida] subhashii TaxID=561895 RepID=A0A8J5QRX9_9ASCO|nr:uncharacterized protein J8A68_002296 [[Candida] subhashii]KAG7664192.1 hypothetical protein J8A68_002296 [[Candida] subhashii]